MNKRLLGAASAFCFMLSSPGLAQVVVAPSPQAADPGAARANDELINFNVPAGPVSRVLDQIIGQARASVSTVRDLGDTPANGVNGRMTLVEALSVALNGTGWRAEIASGGSIEILRDASSASAGSDRVVITARRTDFARTETSVLTRTNTPLRQTPATVDSVTEEVMESQNVMSVAEALRNVPGVVLLNGTGTSIMVGDGVTDGITFTGGLRNSSLTGNAPITDVDSVEVLKGVASILSGTQVSGGIVNYVSKRADGAETREASVGAGTGAEFLSTFDIGGQFPGDTGFAYRAAGQVQFADSRPNGSNDPYSNAINGMLGYRGDTFSADAAVQVFNTKTALVELASFDPATGQYTRYGSRLNPDQHATIESTRLTYGFETELVSGPDFNLQLRARGLVQDATSDLQVQTPLAYDFFGSGTFAINAAGHSEQTQYSNYADLFAEFSTAGIQHKAIVALDVSEQQTQTQSSPLGFVNTTGDTFPLNPIDRSVPKSYVNEQQYGVVVQDQMTLGDWHVLLGLRQSWYRNSTQTSQDPNSRIIVPADAFLPSVGVVYDVLPELSVYASYREGFVPLSPQSYPTFDNRPLLPSLQTRYEAGFKSGLFDDRLTLNASYYEYETENEGVIDLTNSIPPNTYYENGPGSKGEGYELSAAGSITPSFKILAGYAHQEIKRLDGNAVTGRPQDIANIWAIKTFDLSGDMTLDLGFGANYNSGSTAFSITASALAGVPVFFDLDREFLAFRATAGLRFADTRINLSIDNLFDRENYEPVDSIDAVPLAPPRVVRLVLSQAF